MAAATDHGLADEATRQAALSSQLIDFAAHLREGSVAMYDSLRADVASLDTTSQLLHGNAAATSAANKDLREENEVATASLWGTMRMLVFGVAVWAVAYTAIKWLPMRFGWWSLLFWWWPF